MNIKQLFENIFISVPTQYVGRTLRLSGWANKVIAGFIPAHILELKALLSALDRWAESEDRTIVRVLNPDSFVRRKTGEDNAYHGIVFSQEPLNAGEYEIIGSKEDFLNLLGISE